MFCDGQVAAGMEPNPSDGNSFLVYDDIWSSSLPLPTSQLALLISAEEPQHQSTRVSPDEHWESCIYLNIDHHVFCPS